MNKKPPEPKDRLIQFRVTTKMYKELDKIRKEHRLTRQALLAWMIDGAIEDWKAIVNRKAR